MSTTYKNKRLKVKAKAETAKQFIVTAVKHIIQHFLSDVSIINLGKKIQIMVITTRH